MIHHALMNLYVTLKSLLCALYHRVPGWRYPLTSRLDDGYVFNGRTELIELVGFNRIKYSLQRKLMDCINSPLVLVAVFVDGALEVTAYRLIDDTGQQDISHPTMGVPGKEGLFYYHYYRGTLYHALRPTSVTRRMGFIVNEPVFGVRIPLTTNEVESIAQYRVIASPPAGQ